MISTVWRTTSTWCGAHGAGPAPGENLSTWTTLCRVLSTEREADRVHWLRGWERTPPWSTLFLLESVWGRTLSWGCRLRSGRLAGGLELPDYLVLFLSWRTKANARFCLPFLLRLKAVRCKGGRFFFFCHFGEWSCLLSNFILILHYHYWKKRKLEGHLWSLLFTLQILFMLSSYLTALPRPLWHSQYLDFK